MRTVRESYEKCTISKTVPTIDEIQQYQDARYVSASGAAWMLLSFPMVGHQPPVERLEVHLEGHHTIYFESGSEHQAVLKGEENPTKLMGWFKANTNFSRHFSGGTRKTGNGNQEQNIVSKSLILLCTTSLCMMPNTLLAECTTLARKKVKDIFCALCFCTEQEWIHSNH